MNENYNSEKQNDIDSIDYNEEVEPYPLGSFGIDEPDDEEHRGLCTDNIIDSLDLYHDDDQYGYNTISQLEAEEFEEEQRCIYMKGDRILSEKQIRDGAEKRGVSIIDFVKYCKQNNIERIDEDRQKDNTELVEKSSSPEQRKKLAKLALALINALEILEYAHMATGDISAESEARRYIKQAIILQRDINGEAHDEIAVEAAVQPFKDELVSKYTGPNNVTEFNIFLENQKKIKNDYDQEVKASLKKSPNHNNKKWHKN